LASAEVWARRKLRWRRRAATSAIARRATYQPRILNLAEGDRRRRLVIGAVVLVVRNAVLCVIRNTAHTIIGTVVPDVIGSVVLVILIVRAIV